MDALSSGFSRPVAVGASLLVIGQRNPMHSVLLLIVSFGALSGLYVLLGAPFVAAIQIIIYAGAIMVLFLFVVMLLNVPTEDADRGRSAAAWRRRAAPLRRRAVGGAGRRAGLGAVAPVAGRRRAGRRRRDERRSRDRRAALHATTRSRSRRRRC